MRLMVFCKAPVPGRVKTRLLSGFSADEACAIHEALASETLQDCLAVQAERPNVKLELWCNPDGDHEFFQRFESLGFELHIQSGLDLGEKMYRGFAHSDKPALLVGTDCPPVDAPYMARACRALEGSDVVLGPAEDGGYGLIGLNRANASVFADINWSTEKVLDQTLARCKATSLEVELLPLIWDVDFPEDVARWRTAGLAKQNQYQ